MEIVPNICKSGMSEIANSLRAPFLDAGISYLNESYFVSAAICMPNGDVNMSIISGVFGTT